MLPFLQKKDAGIAGLIIKNRTPDKTSDSQSEPDDSSVGIEACAQDLIRAVQNNDVKAAAQAIKDAFTILESQPHEEGSSEDNSYAAQNAKAAKQSKGE